MASNDIEVTHSAACDRRQFVRQLLRDAAESRVERGFAQGRHERAVGALLVSKGCIFWGLVCSLAGYVRRFVVPSCV